MRAGKTGLVMFVFAIFLAASVFGTLFFLDDKRQSADNGTPGEETPSADTTEEPVAGGPSESDTEPPSSTEEPSDPATTNSPEPDATEDGGSEPDVPQHSDMRVTSIQPGQEITSPVVVKGEARGSWFFEGDFPLVLTDWDGRIIAQGYATAKGEWMTSDFVEFEGVLEFTAPEYGERGFLILQKANPSGLPEHDDAIEIEVRFASSKTADTMPVKVYFTTAETGTDTCEATDYVEREIPKTLGVGRAAIEQLLAGPTKAEKEAGYTTSINPGTKLQSLRVENGTAYADFNEELDKNTGGSCLVTAIYTQIANTLKQFPTVDSVVISINGETEEVLQP